MKSPDVSQALSQAHEISEAIFEGKPSKDRRALALWHWFQIGAAVVAVITLGYHAVHGVGLGLDSDTTFYVTLVIALLAFFAFAFASAVLSRMQERHRIAGAVQSRLHHLQNKLSYREDLLKLVSDHQPGAIMIFDRQNRYWFVNERAADAIGKPMSEIIGQPPAKILPPEIAKRFDQRLAEAREAERAVEYIDRVVIDGETRFIQEHYEALGVFAEQEGCVLVSEDDLTSLIVERERRERMLRQVIDTLVAVVDRRDPYASGHSSRGSHVAPSHRYIGCRCRSARSLRFGPLVARRPIGARRGRRNGAGG